MSTGRSGTGFSLRDDSILKAVLVTGANGFIGSVLCKRLVAEKCNVSGTVRSGENYLLVRGVKSVKIGDIDTATDWGAALRGIDTVVHLAARVHVMKDSSIEPLQAYREVNVHGTERLALQAADVGVNRFIFMSTVKVNGEENRKAYTESDIPSPMDSYGISKMEAEKKITDISVKTGMEAVILRPPLVYGPGVKANFLSLLQIIDRGIPLPLASANNQRSMIYVENLVDAILQCIRNPNAAGQTYLVSDGQNVSTPGLIRMIAAALQKQPRLFRFPPLALYIASRLTGKGQAVDRLIGSLTVDMCKIKNELGWKPPFTFEVGVKNTVFWYKSIKNSNNNHLRLTTE
jgi:nucleoside-diphosphate-sugar epimerase